MISINNVVIEPTIFPDGTSQVWHLPVNLVDHIQLSRQVDILWQFEHEAEVLHYCQLVRLVRDIGVYSINLDLPYLPYARQDKEVGNEETFALRVFLSVLRGYFDTLTVFDPHSNLAEMLLGRGRLIAVEPEAEIATAIAETGTTMLCYPDVGASKRYPFLTGYQTVTLAKTRDPATGEITGLEAVVPTMLTLVKDQSVLIVDDLCDGGRTFIESAKLLLTAGAKEVNLYVSHGLFSKGTQVLYDAGIKRIFTKDGEVE